MRKQLSFSVLAAASIISAGLFVGCDQTDTTSKPAASSTPPSSSSVPAMTPPTTTAPAIGDAAQTAKGSADAALKTATDAIGSKPVGDPAVPAIPAVPAVPGAPATTDAAAPAGTDAESVSKAKELMTQATAYIKDNKLDLAQKAIDQLDTLKPKLPAEYQPKIDSIHSAFDAMKKGGDLKDSLKNGLLGK